MATVIDALLVTLGLDSKEFRKGSEESQNDLEKLRKKAEDVAQEVKGRGAQAGEFFLKFAERAAVLIGVGVSLHELRQAIVETAGEYVDLAKLADQFHTTADAIDEFADTGKLLGLSNDVTVGGLKDLDKAVQDTALGIGRAKIIFESIGLSVKDAAGNVKPTTQVMGELADKLKDMERGKQIRVMERLGLNPALLKLFTADLADIQRRTEAIDKATGFSLDTAVKNSQQFMKAIKGVQVEINSLKMFFEKLFETAYIRVMPFLSEMMVTAKEYVGDFFDFMTDHKDIVVGVFVAIGAAVAYYLLPALVSTASAAVATIAPFLGIAAAIAAVVAIFAVLYEDWAVWMDGGKSQLGEFWQFFADIWGKIGGTVTAVLGDAVTVFKSAFAVLIDTVKFFSALFSGNAEDIRRTWGNLCSSIGALWGDLWQLEGDVIDAAVATIKAAFSALWAGLQFGASEFSAWLNNRIGLIAEYFDDIAPNAMRVFRDIRDGAFAAFSAIADIVQYTIAVVIAVVTGFVPAMARVADGVKNIWSGLWSGLRSVASSVLDWLMGRLEAVTGLFSKIGQAIGLVKGPQGAVGTAQAASSVTDTPAPVAPFLRPSALDSAAALDAARPAFAASAIPPSIANNTDSKTTVTKETHIGEIVINTQAQDAQGIAQDISGAVQSNSLADQADAGI